MAVLERAREDCGGGRNEWLAVVALLASLLAVLRMWSYLGGLWETDPTAPDKGGSAAWSARCLSARGSDCSREESDLVIFLSSSSWSLVEYG